MTTSINETVDIIITAGGASSRFGSNKLFAKIGDKEVIRRTVEAFAGYNIILCAAESDIARLKKMFPDIKIVQGGALRKESVFNGLKESAADYCLIHDGARPNVSPDLVKRAVEFTIEKGAMSVAVPATDTIKEVKDGVVIKTLDRSKLYNTQTPQGFKRELILKAHEIFAGENFTDDASMVEKLGEKVYILNGSPSNIKITTPDDIAD
jgi:2-C-methyl-D-erythritol 4-phosphate cytidylyltransferase